jgi:hypothetical protein
MLFFKSLASKPLERNPLKYPVVWYLSSLHPRIGLDPETALSFFEKLLQKLLSCRWLSAEKCDEAKLEFSTLLSEANKYHSTAFKTVKETERVDVFYAKLLGEDEKYRNLWAVMKLVFVLSHGQADIERGF